MDISRINDKSVDNTIQSTRTKVDNNEFEKRLKNALDNKDERELKKACKEFEGILLGIVYKQMKATVPKADLIPSDAGRDIFEGLLDEKLVEEASKNRSYGLADELYKQLGRHLKSGYQE
ncbi:MAG: rod-binding protein [Bacillota bacterium]